MQPSSRELETAFSMMSFDKVHLCDDDGEAFEIGGETRAFGRSSSGEDGEARPIVRCVCAPTSMGMRLWRCRRWARRGENGRCTLG